MSKILYIKGNPKSIEDSRCLTLGDEFVKAYKKANPGDEIIEIDLFKDTLIEIDHDLLHVIENSKFGTGSGSAEESVMKKMEIYDGITDQFVQADKYIFATPMWNLALPGRVKTYIDAVCVTGKSFKYTATGPEGLLKNKKCVHLHASGGFHSSDPKNHGDAYLKDIMGFMGVSDYKNIIVEGYSALPHKADEIVKAAHDRIPETVAWFS